MSKSINRAVTDRSDDSIGQLVHALAATASKFSGGGYRWGSPQVKGAWIGSRGQIVAWRRSYVGRMSFVRELYQRRHRVAFVYLHEMHTDARIIHADRELQDEDYEGYFEGVRFDPFFPLAGHHR